MCWSNTILKKISIEGPVTWSFLFILSIAIAFFSKFIIKKETLKGISECQIKINTKSRLFKLYDLQLKSPFSVFFSRCLSLCPCEYEYQWCFTFHCQELFPRELPYTIYHLVWYQLHFDIFDFSVLERHISKCSHMISQPIPPEQHINLFNM